jgi:hypothetical protein
MPLFSLSRPRVKRVPSSVPGAVLKETQRLSVANVGTDKRKTRRGTVPKETYMETVKGFSVKVFSLKNYLPSTQLISWRCRDCA